MPKLCTPENITINAVIALFKLYLKEPEFVAEFQKICLAHQNAIRHAVLCWVASHREATTFSDPEYQAIIQHLQQELSNVTIHDLNPAPCIRELNELAWRWKLKMPDQLAGKILFICKMGDELRSLSITPIVVPAFHSHYLDGTNQFIMEIFPWQLAEEGQEEIIKQVRKQLSEYTQGLRKIGLSDYPYALEQHAQWWFEHEVHHKTYVQLAQPDNKDPESIKRAVSEFRKFLHIHKK